MKKYILALFLSLVIAPVIASGWTPISPEQAEYEMIMRDIAWINEYSVAMRGFGGTGHHNMLFEYLRNVGSETSLKVLKELVNSGQLPKHYLDNI